MFMGPGTFPALARLRVSGAMTMRLGSRSGPSWKGSNRSGGDGVMGLPRNKRDSAAGQRAGMKRQMLADEGRNEVIAVVVAVLHPQLERNVARGAGRLQILREQLFGEKLVAGAMVDQRRWQRRAGLDQAGGVPGFPGL